MPWGVRNGKNVLKKIMERDLSRERVSAVREKKSFIPRKGEKAHLQKKRRGGKEEVERGST